MDASRAARAAVEHAKAAGYGSAQVLKTSRANGRWTVEVDVGMVAVRRGTVTIDDQSGEVLSSEFAAVGAAP